MSNIDFFQIGAVFAELGQLIEEDEGKRTKFTDIPSDIMKIIKSHVTTFKDKKEQFNFLSHFQKKRNQDIYKFFYEKEPKYFTVEYYSRYILSPHDQLYERYNYKFYLDVLHLTELAAASARFWSWSLRAHGGRHKAADP